MPEHDEEQHPDLGADEMLEGTEVVWPTNPHDIPVDPGLTRGPSRPVTPSAAQEGPHEPSDQAEPLPSPGGPVYASYDPVVVREATPVVALHDEEGNPLPEFDPKYREEFSGLLYLGSLSETFTWLGHRFVVRTLMADELLAVTLLTKEFDDSLGQGFAYKTATVACATVSVDGKELPIPIGASDNVYEWAEMRFNHVRRWFAPTIEEVYAHYLPLDETVGKVVVAMGKAQGQPASTTG